MISKQITDVQMNEIEYATHFLFLWGDINNIKNEMSIYCEVIIYYDQRTHNYKYLVFHFVVCSNKKFVANSTW